VKISPVYNPMGAIFLVQIFVETAANALLGGGTTPYEKIFLCYCEAVHWLKPINFSTY
jgi:hypothetical protein